MNTLVELAVKARSQPTPGSGPYSYIHTKGWYLGTAQMANGRVLDARIEETDREFWVAADGNGRIEETRDGRRSPMSGVYGPGGLGPRPILGPPAGGAPGAFEMQNLAGTPVGWLENVRSIWLAQTVVPALQAALLIRLATQQWLQLEETTDWAGRRGIAVGTEELQGRPGSKVRRVLVLDPDTGMLLAAEEIALQAGGLPVRTAATVNYTLWLKTGYATDFNARP